MKQAIGQEIKSRLDRNLSGRFGSQSYAMEELIAELSSAFTCAKTGIVKHTIENHACYLKSWLQVLKKMTLRQFSRQQPKPKKPTNLS